jgi:hypothetical protein
MVLTTTGRKSGLPRRTAILLVAVVVLFPTLWFV